MSLPLNAVAQNKIIDLTLWRSCSPDHPPCAVCGEIIKEIPLRIFKPERNLEIAFHIQCASNGVIDFGNSEENEERVILNACDYCKKKEKCIYTTDKSKFQKKS